MNLENQEAPDFPGDTLETVATNSKPTALRNSVIASLMVAVAVCLGLAFHPMLGKLSLFLVLPIAVLLASRFGGWVPGLLATVLSILGGWFFLTDPPYSFQFANKSEAEGLAVYAISATAISLLGGQVHATLLSKTRSERAARRSESLVRALLGTAATQAASIGIGEWDLGSNRMVWDDLIFAILGIPKAPFVTYEEFARHVHPDDLLAVEAPLQRSIRDKTQGFFEYRFIRPAGEMRHISGAMGATRSKPAK